MKSLADLARLAGFQVLVEASPSCVELAVGVVWPVWSIIKPKREAWR